MKTLILAIGLIAGFSMQAQYLNFNSKFTDIREEYSGFGTSFDLDTNFLIIGTPNSKLMGFGAGVAGMYVKDSNDVFVPMMPLFSAQNPQNYAQYGYQVQIEGFTAVVSAPYHDGPGRTDNGMIEVFEFNFQTGWVSVANFYGTYNNQKLGTTLLLKNGRIYASTDQFSSGNAVFIYNKINGNWFFEDQTPSYNASYQLGASLAAEDSTLYIGAPGVGQVLKVEKTNSWSGYSIVAYNSPGFGQSLDIERQTLCVGRPALNNNTGVVYLLKDMDSIANNYWNMMDTINNPFPDQDDYFGNYVKIKNNQVYVGAVGENTDLYDSNNLSKTGAVYTFHDFNNTNNWQLFQKITAPDRVSLDSFGCHFVLSGDNLVIGAPGQDLDLNLQNYMDNAGAIYHLKACNNWNYHTVEACGSYSFYGNSYTESGLYTTTNPSPTGCDSIQLLNLTIPTFYGNDTLYVCEPQWHNGSIHYLDYQFKDTISSVAGCDSIVDVEMQVELGWSQQLGVMQRTKDTDIYGDVAVQSYLNNNNNRGIRIYRKLNGAWTLQQSIQNNSQYFGEHLQIDSGFIAVSADTFNGSFNTRKIFMYKEDANGQFNLHQIISHTDISNANNSNSDGSVLLRKNQLLVAYPMFSVPGTANKGMVKIYKYNGTQWVFDQNRENPNNIADARFGTSLALNEQYLAIGSPGYTYSGGLTNAGCVYVFSPDGSGQYNNYVRVFNSDPTAGDGFGESIAFCKNRLVAGFPGRSFTVPNPFQSNNWTGKLGGVRVFEKQNNSWTEIANIPTQSGQAYKTSLLGNYVAADNELIVVGDPNYGSGFNVTDVPGNIRVYHLSDTGNLSLLKQLDNNGNQDMMGHNIAIHDGQISSASRNDNLFEVLEYDDFKYIYQNHTGCDPITWRGLSIESTGLYYDTVAPAGNTCGSIYRLNANIRGNAMLGLHSNGVSLSVSNVPFTGNYNVVWFDCTNNTPITSSMNPSYTPTSSGSYYAVYSNSYGCVDTTDCYNYIMASTDLNTEARLFNIYPNPTSGQLNIDLSNTEAFIRLQIVDLNGRIVQDNSYESVQHISTHLEGLSGLYMLHLFSDKERLHTHKIIKL